MTYHNVQEVITKLVTRAFFFDPTFLFSFCIFYAVVNICEYVYSPQWLHPIRENWLASGKVEYKSKLSKASNLKLIKSSFYFFF